MSIKQKSGASGMMILPLVLLNGIVIRNGYTENQKWWWLLIVTLPLLLLAILNNRKKGPVKLETPPVVRRAHYSFESDQHKHLISRRELSHYIRFKVFSKSR